MNDIYYCSYMNLLLFTCLRTHFPLLVKPHQRPHHPPIFNILSLIFNFFSLLISQLIVILFLTFSVSLSFSTHKRLLLSLSLTHFLSSFLVDFYFILYFSFISTLGWWIFVLFGTLHWVVVIKFCVFKLLTFLFSLISSYCIIKIVVGSRFTIQAQNVWSVGPMSPIQ